MRKAEIRKYALEVLQQYERKRGKKLTFPIDAADIFDRLFGLETIYDDRGILNQTIGGKIIGCIFPDGCPSPWGKDKLIVINVTPPENEPFWLHFQPGGG